MCGIPQRKSKNNYERSVFHHNGYDYSRCTKRIVVRLEYSRILFRNNHIFCFHAVNEAGDQTASTRED